MEKMKMFKFGVEVILFFPDNNAFKNIQNYINTFEYVFVYDNTPQKNITYNFDNSKKICYVSNGNNDGMSVALEEGIKWATNQNIDFLLTMDQDSDYSIENIHRMINYINENDNEKIAIYASNYQKVVFQDCEPVLCKPKYRRGEDCDVGFSMTSGSFMRIQAVSKILPLDNLFIGFVDNDICYKLRVKGYRIRLVSEAVFHQRVGAPIPNTVLNKIFHKLLLSEERYYLMGRNSAYLKKKYKTREIRKEIRGIRLRILFNLIFFEYNRIKKLSAWYRGSLSWKTICK